VLGLKIHIPLVLALLVMATGAQAVDRLSDAKDFKDFVTVCTANPDERGLDGCIEDQVMSQDSYLGDILAETANALDPKAAALLDKSQAAFVAYRERTCAYQAGVNGKGDKEAALFCVLRLTNQRIADVLEGEDFLALD
jgi:uncharacterized protein YecT (DUF1311 family)